MANKTAQTPAFSQTAIDGYTNDMAKGFGGFVDDVLRGRENKTILNSSIGLGALEIGIPKDGTSIEIPRMLMNNSQLSTGALDLKSHPLFDFTTAENFTLFGLDFPDFYKQFFPEHYSIPNPALQKAPNVPATDELGVFKNFKDKDALGDPNIPATIPYESDHVTPYYDNNLAEKLGLPDLPYGGMAHFAHMGLALYDTGRTFQDLWNEPALKHNVVKIMTHPEMTETLLHRGVMLTVMGLTHALGPIVSIGLGYLCGHLVHSAFKLLENNKDTIREIENIPVLKHIYNATGIKEWAEAKKDVIDEPKSAIDPLEGAPEHTPSKEDSVPNTRLHNVDRNERLEQMARALERITH